MTAWRERLAALARDRLPAEAVEPWLGLVRPAVHLVREGDGEPVGQLGGDPALPDDVAWPVWDERGPLTFIGSVDCARLPPELDTLPEHGTLLFFYFDGRYDEDDDLPAEPEDLDGNQVIFVPAGTPTTERAAPVEHLAYPRRELHARLVGSAPDVGHVLLETTTTADGVPLSKAGSRAGLFGELAWAETERTTRHQIGGYGTAIQDASETEIAAMALESRRRDPRLAEEGARWVLLAQFDSDDDVDMMWGDVGTIYWAIRSDELAAGRFETARFTMQCT
ncbi:YwqG family protein [Amycolatopsis rhabdoformis]|uniref:YwqG family protein n=1 Tax=Amycolatopsis rhabdoformis TaxID=1448059 RepID=A0ABZ1I9J4_9PSEU|nr:YwqG family protein [Amycolatopsis rhabdoformis]WSE30726.1 YwqG family protein [Amycolatopsis rhabdoformis]